MTFVPLILSIFQETGKYLKRIQILQPCGINLKGCLNQMLNENLVDLPMTILIYLEETN
jgi:hypothetical protein